MILPMVLSIAWASKGPVRWSRAGPLSSECRVVGLVMLACQSPPVSVTAIRAAFSLTMAWFLANAAVRALIARFAGGVVDRCDGVGAE